jgi:hypothetical protein
METLHTEIMDHLFASAFAMESLRRKVHVATPHALRVIRIIHDARVRRLFDELFALEKEREASAKKVPAKDRGDRAKKTPLHVEHPDFRAVWER